MDTTQRLAGFWAFSAASLMLISGCVESGDAGRATTDTSLGSGDGAASPGGGELKGRIIVDGSSTVEPITKAMAVEFGALHADVEVDVGVSGTGGGFEKFYKGETDINDASRPIKDREAAVCKENGIEFLELKVAIDGLSVVINPENDWCKALTTAQLRKLWEPGSEVKTWKQLDPSWPDEAINLYGPDTDSGTFDYFTKAINGEEKASRDDYEANTNDNILVQGVAGDKYALGYFGFAYYVENQDKLTAVPISLSESAGDAVAPTIETILSGEYKPLSRPLFIYPNRKKLAEPHMAAFLQYFLGDGQQLVKEVGYVELKPDDLEESRKRLAAALSAARK